MTAAEIRSGVERERTKANREKERNDRFIWYGYTSPKYTKHLRRKKALVYG